MKRILTMATIMLLWGAFVMPFTSADPTTTAVSANKSNKLSKSVKQANHQAIKQIPTKSGAQYNTYTCKIDGVERTYKLYLPAGIEPNAPLIFVLHGYGGSFNLDHIGINEVADRQGFAVCYPMGAKDGRGKNCWNVGYPFQHDMPIDDISFLCTLAKHLQAQHSLSRHNTFCTGMSNGGEMCYLLAYSNQKCFKAVAPIAGLTMEWMPKAYTRTRPIPLFEVHGTEDRVSEWTGDLENKGGWGAYIAVPDAISHWVECNKCTDKESITLPLKSPESNTVIAHRYSSGKRDCEVWLYEIIGGGHTWGNNDLDTPNEIWHFFSKFVK